MSKTKAVLRKELVNEVFKAIRKKGYKAVQSFSCCGSCGFSEMENLKAEKFVFTTKQDTFESDYNGKYTNYTLYLKWEGNGQEIVDAINSVDGVVAVWDGSETTCVGISTPEMEQEKIDRTINDFANGEMEVKGWVRYNKFEDGETSWTGNVYIEGKYYGQVSVDYYNKDGNGFVEEYKNYIGVSENGGDEKWETFKATRLDEFKRLVEAGVDNE
jgi:hypothetical protein